MRHVANAAFLVASYLVLVRGFTPRQAYNATVGRAQLKLPPFRDAGWGPSQYDLGVLDCLRGLSRAQSLGWVDLATFDPEYYEHWEAVENGDLNWIIPSRIVAMCSPMDHAFVAKNNITDMFHTPEFYVKYFHLNNVSTIIRLNMKEYNRETFIKNGIEHVDSYFEDNTTPNNDIRDRFLRLVDNCPGAIAVHCKSGVGRTGTLIACYLMRKYRFTAPEAIAYIRIMRPGSIVGQQQPYLIRQQPKMWALHDREKTGKAPSMRRQIC